jgi:TPR repeat protein
VGLIVMAVVMMVISVSGVVLAYNELSGSQEPEYQARMLTELRTRVERGEAAAQYALGNLYYRGVDGVVKNRQEAVNWYREAADRGHTGAQLMLGLCYLHGEGTAQNYEKSIPWLRKVAAQGNQKAQFYLGLDYAEGSLGVKRDMTDHFQYLAWLGPLALAAAGLTAVVGMVRKRKSIFDPALCMAMVLAVGALSWRWRYGGVEKLWQNTIVRDPNYYLACRNLGNALIQTGQEDKAQACLQKAVELDPDDANTHYNLGVLLTQKGQLDEAIIHYRKAAELQPDYAEAHNNLGYALAKKGQLDEAIVHYRKAAELQPDYAQAHNNLGYALVIKGQWDGAIRQYQEALRLQPDFAKASNNLVVVLGLKAAAAKQPASSTKP